MWRPRSVHVGEKGVTPTPGETFLEEGTERVLFPKSGALPLKPV